MLFADLAQLAEHVTSNDEVEGSNPLVSTNIFSKQRPLDAVFYLLIWSNSGMIINEKKDNGAHPLPFNREWNTYFF